MVKKIEIARALGLSHTCVGAVLNDRPNSGISELTRRRVLDRARLMGYESNQRPKQVVCKSTISYILCGPGSSEAIYMGIFYALRAEAVKDRRQVSFVVLDNDSAALTECLRSIDDNEPLGIVLEGKVTEDLVMAITERGLPFVVSGATRYAHDKELVGSVNAVSVDISGAVSQLMQWFYRQGSRRVALSIGAPEVMVNSLIIDGYRQSAERSESGYDPALVQIGEESRGQDIVGRLSYLGIDYDALLFGSIERTIRALSFLNLMPEKVRKALLMGAFGSLSLAGMLPENVGVCGPNLWELGREIYSILAAEINYAAVKKRVSILPCVHRWQTFEAIGSE
jgi:DNA-binding LacI/PurR family transcriptional regulator